MLSRLLTQFHEILQIDDVAFSRYGRYNGELDRFFQNGCVLCEDITIGEFVNLKQFRFDSVRVVFLECGITHQIVLLICVGVLLWDAEINFSEDLQPSILHKVDLRWFIVLPVNKSICCEVINLRLASQFVQVILLHVGEQRKFFVELDLLVHLFHLESLFISRVNSCRKKYLPEQFLDNWLSLL